MLTEEENWLSNCKGVNWVGELQKEWMEVTPLEVDHERRK
jgi:hypothetical protein